MLVRDIPYNFEMLDVFAVNELYRKCQRQITEDFEKTHAEFISQELPDTLTEAQIAGVAAQKTGYLSAFISGHLNFADPNSAFFVKFNELLGPDEEKKSALSGLILPPHLRA